MHPSKQLRLEQTMSDLAAGDPAAVWQLVDDFGDDLQKSVLSVISESGRSDILSDQGRVASLMLDVACAMSKVAGSWDPAGGALPWVWARREVRRIVFADMGHRAESMDDELFVVSAADWNRHIDYSHGDVSVETLAASDPRWAQLFDLLARVASPRDVAVCIEFNIQSANGDPSPSSTVAEMFGLSSSNVRKIASRVRLKAKKLAQIDPEFAQIGDAPWLAA